MTIDNTKIFRGSRTKKNSLMRFTNTNTNTNTYRGKITKHTGGEQQLNGQNYKLSIQLWCYWRFFFTLKQTKQMWRQNCNIYITINLKKYLPKQWRDPGITRSVGESQAARPQLHNNILLSRFVDYRSAKVLPGWAITSSLIQRQSMKCCNKVINTYTKENLFMRQSSIWLKKMLRPYVFQKDVHKGLNFIGNFWCSSPPSPTSTFPSTPPFYSSPPTSVR